jgi:ankyrin repeat protein
MLAAVFGRVDCMRLLLEKNADVASATASTGGTALLHAALYGHPECVQLLVEAKAGVNSQADQEGWTGVYCACQDGNVECLRLLIKKNLRFLVVQVRPASVLRLC